MFYVCYFAAGRIETWQWARAYFQISQAVKKKKKKKKNAFVGSSTKSSTAVTHPATNRDFRCLTLWKSQPL